MKANTIEISVEEFSRLKDIETRFVIMKEQMNRADYCPIHWQIILDMPPEEESQFVHFQPLIAKKEGGE